MNKFFLKRIDYASIVASLCLIYSVQVLAQSPFKPEFVKKTNGFVISVGESGRSIDINDKFTSFIEPEKFVTGVECNKVESITDSLKQNIKNIHGPMLQSQCSAVDEYNKDKKLSSKICLNLAGCFKQQTRGSSQLADIISNAKNQMAIEAVSLIAKKNIDNMVDFQALKTFASNKYGADFLPESCSKVDIFETDKYMPEVPDAKCRTTVIDQGVESAMKNCNLVDSGCHNDFVEFMKNKTLVHGKSMVSEFFQKKALKQGDVAISQNDNITRAIAEVFAKKTLSEEERVNEAFVIISNRYQELDPVFKNYYQISTESRTYKKHDAVKASLMSWLKQANLTSVDEIEAKLQDLKKSEAKSLLTKKCKNAMTMKGMCLAVSDVLVGFDFHVDRGDFNRMTSRDKPLVSTTPTFHFDLAKQVARCNTFILNSSSSSLVLDTDNLSGNYDLFSSFDDELGLFMDKKIRITNGRNDRSGIVLKVDGTIERKSESSDVLNQKMVMRAKEKESSSDNEMVLVKKFSVNAQLPEVYQKKDTEFSSNLNQPTQVKKETALGEPTPIAQREMTPKTITENSYVDNKTIITDRSRVSSQNESNYQAIQNASQNANQNERENSKVKNNNAELLGRVSELEGRLKRVNEAQAENTKKKNESVSSGKESEVSRDLASIEQEIENFKKSQIQKKLKQDVAEESPTDKREQTQKVTNNSSDEIDSIDSRQSDAPTVSNRASSSASSYSGDSSNSDSSSISKSGGQSTKSSSLTDSGAELSSSESSGKMEGIVLTKVDTANGSITETDALAKLIFAESGKPFYIEEEGMVKIVVPELADGKLLLDDKGQPVYKKIIKGKVGKFKITNSDKNIASPKSSSPADVKRLDEEKKRPTIRYKDFKEAIKASLDDNRPES